MLATQEAEIRRIATQSQPGQMIPRDPISKKPNTKRAVEWLKVYALSSSPSTGGREKKYN
jgi:hypothetical protein